MDIQNLNTQSGTGVKTLPAKAPQSLGQADFLKLLTTQLTSQSPLSPMKNEAFVAQMAQFSTVSGIAEMNQSLKAVSARLGGQDMALASRYIGRQALVPARSITVAAGSKVRGAVDVKRRVDTLAIEVRNAASGALVDTVQLGPRAAGMSDFKWSPPAAGAYTFTASGVTGGKQQSVSTLLGGTVTAITPGKDGPTLSVRGIGQVAATRLARLSL